MVDVLMDALSLYKQSRAYPPQKTEPAASLAKATAGSEPYGG